MTRLLPSDRHSSNTLLSSGAINLFVLCYGVCMALIMQSYMLVGDDLVYASAMNHYAERYGPFGWPAYCVGHWISTNGRLANFLAPVFISELPRWFTDICVGASYSILLILILRTVRAGTNSFCLQAVLIGLTLLTLPWYDDLMLYDCWLNYVVTIVLTLWWLLLWERNKGSVILLIIMGFIAAMMHESCSVATSVGLIIRLLVDKHSGWNCRRKLIAAVAYWIGCALCASSPGMMSRMADNPLATDRLFVLFSSNFYIVLLAITVGLLVLSARGKEMLRNLLQSNWSTYSFAALTGSIISIYSGIAGRSGFFAQIFALIALFIIVRHSRLRIRTMAAATIGSVILIISGAQMIYTLYIQSHIAQESRNVFYLMEQSKDGVVYQDMKVSYNPPAFSLGKCVALPKRTEVWKYSILQRTLAPEKQIMILPEVFSNIDFSTGNTRTSYNDCRILPAVGLCLKDTILKSQGDAQVQIYGNMLATPVRLSGHDYIVLDPMP